MNLSGLSQVALNVRLCKPLILLMLGNYLISDNVYLIRIQSTNQIASVIKQVIKNILFNMNKPIANWFNLFTLFWFRCLIKNRERIGLFIHDFGYTV